MCECERWGRARKKGGLENECMIVGPWLWKEVENKEEKVKSELRGRHGNCHWVKVSKRVEKPERSAKKLVIG